MWRVFNDGPSVLDSVNQDSDSEILWDADLWDFPARGRFRFAAKNQRPASVPASGQESCGRMRERAQAGVPVPLEVAKALVGWGKLQ